MTPPIAATSGRSAARRLVRAPTVISRRISRPTIKKKSVKSPSESHSRVVSESKLPTGPMPRWAFIARS
jgi:hypothetical protein